MLNRLTYGELFVLSWTLLGVSVFLPMSQYWHGVAVGAICSVKMMLTQDALRRSDAKRNARA